MQLLGSNMYPQSELDNYKLQVDLLQEKLKQSEENRQQLQKELHQILQRRSEHDKSVRTEIRQKYQSFLDEQERRSERNKMLMQMIERIDQQTAALSARSERLKMMKLQYERYFAKLMQAQPMRCIPNAVPTSMTSEGTISAMAAPAQIPVLLPAVAPQLPTTAPPLGTPSGLKSERVSMPVNATVQPTTGHLQTMADTHSTALTPRMWTFAMATPTSGGLLLSGAPTTTLAGGTLPTTAAPIEFLQYPLGYGPIIQQQPLHQQIPYVTAISNSSTMAFENQNDSLHGNSVSLREKKQGILNKHEQMDHTVKTAEAATSTEIPNMIGNTTSRASGKQTENKVQESGKLERSGNISANEHAKSTQITSTESLDQFPRHQPDYATATSAVNTRPVIFREPTPSVNEVITNVSAVKLEDVDNIDEVISEPVSLTSARTSYNFEQDNSKATSENNWKEANIIHLSTAEEHRRKIAEIEQRYGTNDTTEDTDYVNNAIDIGSNETYTGFKRFSEIVNPKHEPSVEKLSTTNEILDNHSWESHTGSIENAAMLPTSKVSSASKSFLNSKIDNIENAIYGELVNPHLPETEAPTTRTAAQGFFTELLEQQETPSESNMLQQTKAQEQEYTTKNEMETSRLSEDTNYDNYYATIENDNTGDPKAENPIKEAADPQNQTTYGSSSQEVYQPVDTFTAESAYGTAESANNYSDYPIEQNIDANTAEPAADQQQQEQQPNYSQEDYENYDATQYSNYDPNAYPGYIYDETTGQYVVDPQYVAPDATNADEIYATQEYTEQQEQQQDQMVYPTDQAQEVSYAYEEQAPTTTEQTLDVTATPAEVVNLPTLPPAAVEPPVATAPKLVKPTSILSTTEKHALQSDAQKKKKRVIFVDSSETDDSSGAKAPEVGGAAAGGESDFDFSSGAETSVG